MPRWETFVFLYFLSQSCILKFADSYYIYIHLHQRQQQRYIKTLGIFGEPPYLLPESLFLEKFNNYVMLWDRVLNVRQFERSNYKDIKKYTITWMFS